MALTTTGLKKAKKRYDAQGKLIRARPVIKKPSIRKKAPPKIKKKPGSPQYSTPWNPEPGSGGVYGPGTPVKKKPAPGGGGGGGGGVETQPTPPKKKKPGGPQTQPAPPGWKPPKKKPLPILGGPPKPKPKPKPRPKKKAPPPKVIRKPKPKPRIKPKPKKNIYDRGNR